MFILIFHFLENNGRKTKEKKEREKYCNEAFID